MGPLVVGPGMAFQRAVVVVAVAVPFMAVAIVVAASWRRRLFAVWNSKQIPVLDRIVVRWVFAAANVACVVASAVRDRACTVVAVDI